MTVSQRGSITVFQMRTAVCQGKSDRVHGAEYESVRRHGILWLYQEMQICVEQRMSTPAYPISSMHSSPPPGYAPHFHALCLSETPFSFISCQNPYQSCASQRQLHPSAHSCSDDVKPHVFASHSARPPMTPRLLTTCTTIHPRVFIVSFHRRRPRGSCVA